VETLRPYLECVLAGGWMLCEASSMRIRGVLGTAIFIGVVLCTATVPKASAQESDRLWMPAAWAQWLPDATAARNYADAILARGLNGAGMAIPWSAIERQPGLYDFTWIDERLDILVAKGLRVHLRLDCSRTLPSWFHPVFAQTADGSTYPPGGGIRVISFADEAVLEAVPRVLGAVAAHVWTRYLNPGGPYPVTTIHPMLSPPFEVEYAFEEWTDYSPPAQEGFRAWLPERHGDLATLNSRWGTGFADWSEITLQAAPRFDFQAFRTESLGRLIDRCAEAVHQTPGTGLAVQFGSIWDGLSPYRGTRDAARLARNADWVIVDDSPVFDFAFSMDYLRGMVRDKVWVNEIDGPWTPYLTNAKCEEQGIVSLRRGAYHLWAANWNTPDLLDPKWTFWGPVLEELMNPRPDVRPTRAIFVSLATVYRQDGGRSVQELVGSYYAGLSANDAVPVDFVSDTVVLEHPEWMVQYTGGIHIPASQRWVMDEVVEALQGLTVPVIRQTASAGSLDEYGRPRAWPFPHPLLEVR